MLPAPWPCTSATCRDIPSKSGFLPKGEITKDWDGCSVHQLYGENTWGIASLRRVEVYEEYPEGFTHQRKRLSLPKPHKKLMFWVGRRKTKRHNCYWVSLKGNDSFSPNCTIFISTIISHLHTHFTIVLTCRNKAANTLHTKSTSGMCREQDSILFV